MIMGRMKSQFWDLDSPVVMPKQENNFKISSLIISILAIYPSSIYLYLPYLYLSYLSYLSILSILSILATYPIYLFYQIPDLSSLSIYLA